MPRRAKEDEKELAKKKKVEPAKKRGAPRDDDDSSVDSHGNIRGLIAYSSDTETSSTESEREATVKARKAFTKAKKELAAKKERRIAKEKAKAKLQAQAKSKKTTKGRRVVESESEDSEDEEDGETLGSQDTDEEEEESDDFEEFGGSDDEDEDYDEEEEEGSGTANLVISFGGGEEVDPMVPQRHNMKKESPAVKKFVKLITAPLEDNTIDTQIDQFKALKEEKQDELLKALERRPTIQDTGVNLMLRILTLKIPTEVQALVLAKYNSLQSLDPSTGEYFKLRNWLDKVVSVPFGLYREIPIKMDDGQEACAKFMQGAQKSLDEAIYGQEETKLQILQYITTKIANPGGRGTSLLLVGPPGIGKTSVIKNGIAKALGLPFQFISLGGDSDASTYTGHQLVYESSHCGKIVNSLVGAKSMSAVLLFDEVDKISATPKGEEVQNMLIHLTDPASNEGFEDKYLAGVPIDMSKVMFVFSANDITKIDKVLLDRLMVIELKGYDLKQKITIAENYLLPAALKDVSLVERVAISKEVLTHIIEEYAGEETGVRELKRCIEQVAQKLNMLRMYNAKELPFHIKDFALPFHVKKEHVDLFLKKREKAGPPPHMYM
jgi:ATP-dependent Lon protease